GYGFNKSVDESTLVNIEGSSVQIKNCKVRDTVYGIDEDGNVVTDQVVALHDHGDIEAFQIITENGRSETCSIHHKF
ncbi:hypothetical protein, partial [Limosilactobacillus reuteri]|uniref:hypothetical protein n=1 Tax=Limosilactobacillus reuteri TaxID=1598 RepID=UPI00207D493F